MWTKEGKHYLTVANSNAQNMTGNSKARSVTMWTKEGKHWVSLQNATKLGGTHFITVANCNTNGKPSQKGTPSTYWTKEGVVMLGVNQNCKE